jgi:hypothetical protein
MKAHKFLKLFYGVDSLHQLPSLFYTNEYKNHIYNPLFDVPCLLAPRENSYFGQLVRFHQLINYKSYDDPILCICFPVKNNQTLWEEPIYIALEELEVCECNSDKIDEIIQQNGFKERIEDSINTTWTSS